MRPQSSSRDNQRDSSDYRSELTRLLQVYEPGNEASAAQLLETYAGMEHELVECYRHYYAGKGSFRVALDDNQEAGSPRVSSPGRCTCPRRPLGPTCRPSCSRDGAARPATPSWKTSGAPRPL